MNKNIQNVLIFVNNSDYRLKILDIACSFKSSSTTPLIFKCTSLKSDQNNKIHAHIINACITVCIPTWMLYSVIYLKSYF